MNHKKCALLFDPGNRYFVEHDGTVDQNDTTERDVREDTTLLCRPTVPQDRGLRTRRTVGGDWRGTL